MEIDRASNILDETTDRGFSHPKKLFFKKNFEREIHETIFVYFSMYKRCKIISNEKQWFVSINELINTNKSFKTYFRRVAKNQYMVRLSKERVRETKPSCTAKFDAIVILLTALIKVSLITHLLLWFFRAATFLRSCKQLFQEDYPRYLIVSQLWHNC